MNLQNLADFYKLEKWKFICTNASDVEPRKSCRLGRDIVAVELLYRLAVGRPPLTLAVVVGRADDLSEGWKGGPANWAKNGF